jgi:hypothetical protein
MGGPPADVAQLVEHFTRNEGVPGSSPGVGLEKGLLTPAGSAQIQFADVLDPLPLRWRPGEHFDPDAGGIECEERVVARFVTVLLGRTHLPRR